MNAIDEILSYFDRNGEKILFDVRIIGPASIVGTVTSFAHCVRITSGEDDTWVPVASVVSMKELKDR